MGLTDYLIGLIEVVDDTADFIRGLSESVFVSSLVVRRAVERNIEIIGETRHQIELGFPEFAAKHDSIPYRLAYEMRNLLAHSYWKSEAEIIWEATTNHVPSLRPLRYLSTRSPKLNVPISLTLATYRSTPL
jgi:uncharacterized protein with HEPN domain